MSADPDDFTLDNMAHVIAVNAWVHDDCDHEHWLICGKCGEDLGGPVDE